MSTVDTRALPSGTWRVDKVHSSIGFAVGYMAGKFLGTFGDFDAVVADGVLYGSAKVASVQVADENLAAHMQGPDFFDAQAHPELSFTSETIDRDRFGVSWNNPLPNGEPALSNEVTITAELQMSKQA